MFGSYELPGRAHEVAAFLHITVEQLTAIRALLAAGEHDQAVDILRPVNDMYIQPTNFNDRRDMIIIHVLLSGPQLRNEYWYLSSNSFRRMGG